MIRKIGIVLFFVLLFFADTTAWGRDESTNVKTTIQRYNQLLAECYKKMDMNPMQEVATIEQATDLYIYMAAIGEGKERIESRLKKIDFISVKFQDKNTAIVKDRETWDFRYVNIKTGQVVEEQKDFVYNLIYELVKNGDRWFVKSVTAVDDKRPKHK
ncbi:MAG: hypothetical protein HY754_04905 [Nitrospirae bacterium]|nr:hypothetical protein [Nitrospirota bacterium]